MVTKHSIGRHLVSNARGEMTSTVQASSVSECSRRGSLHLNAVLDSEDRVADSLIKVEQPARCFLAVIRIVRVLSRTSLPQSGGTKYQTIRGARRTPSAQIAWRINAAIALDRRLCNRLKFHSTCELSSIVATMHPTQNMLLPLMNVFLSRPSAPQLIPSARAAPNIKPLQ